MSLNSPTLPGPIAPIANETVQTSPRESQADTYIREDVIQSDSNTDAADSQNDTGSLSLKEFPRKAFSSFNLESLMEEENAKTPTSTPRKITRSSTIKPTQSSQPSQSQPSQNVTINCPKRTKPCKGK